MSTPCWLNPALCAAEAATGAAYDYASEAATDWWYGTSDDVGFTTVPDYGESPIDVPTTTPRASTAPPASSGAATGNGAPPPPPPPGTGSTLSPLWVGAGVVLLGLGGYYAYRTSR